MLILALLGCEGDPTSADAMDTMDTDTPAPAVTYDPTWDGVQQLFADHCDTCHPSQNGLDLRAEIDRLVVAGDPEASDLWEAAGGSSLSTMMPPSGRLPAETVECIEDWILAGAPR